MGAACASTFAREGAELLVVDPLPQVCDEVRDKLAGSGAIAHSQCAAFGDESEINMVARRCEQLWGSVDALVVCAGAFDWWSEGDDTMENWEGLLRVNLLTPIFYTKALRPLLGRSGSASVVYYGSIDGIRGNPRLPAYSVSRGGLVPFTHVMAHTMWVLGVGFNLFSVGYIL
jgi:NAD(P)-dependent dehydrogenase (short-subunit alcohol dehydrogenase family)